MFVYNAERILSEHKGRCSLLAGCTFISNYEKQAQAKVQKKKGYAFF